MFFLQLKISFSIQDPKQSCITHASTLVLIESTLTEKKVIALKTSCAFKIFLNKKIKKL